MGRRRVVLILVAVLALIEGLGGLALGVVSVQLGRLLGGIGGPLGAVLVVGSTLVGLIVCVGPILHASVCDHHGRAGPRSRHGRGVTEVAQAREAARPGHGSKPRTLT